MKKFLGMLVLAVVFLFLFMDLVPTGATEALEEGVGPNAHSGFTTILGFAPTTESAQPQEKVGGGYCAGGGRVCTLSTKPGKPCPAGTEWSDFHRACTYQLGCHRTEFGCMRNAGVCGQGGGEGACYWVSLP